MIVPDWFEKSLKTIDPNLIVYFNPHRGKWIIDRCCRDGEMKSVPHQHTPACPKTNVTVVQDQGQFMPLCQKVLDDLKAMDAWKDNKSVEEYQAKNAADLKSMEEKNERQIDSLWDALSADGKAQLQKAYDLIQRHDVHRINQ